MVHRILVWISLVCCVLVLLSFAIFVRDQVSGASKHQVAELATAAPTVSSAPPRSTKPAQPRRFIDGAAHALTSPFDSIIQSNSQWVRHGVPTVLALLVYGGGIGFLARYTRGLS